VDALMSPYRFIAGGFGTGFVPLAAGTVASAAATVSGAGLMQISPWALPLAAVVAIVGGYLAIGRADVQGDPGWVVIDEFAGQWIALLALPRVSVAGCLLAFVLFRFFDVTKLGPVGWADRRHGAFGIMADDVIAGMIAGVLLALVVMIWPSVVG
jgi:phosphatidylglycerophosphatase A